MAATRTHFNFRIDMWTGDGESIVVDRGQHPSNDPPAPWPSPAYWATALASDVWSRPHPPKCRLQTVKANGLWPTPRIPPRQCTDGTRAYLGSFLHVSAIIF
jgi:hypothetical protein